MAIIGKIREKSWLILIVIGGALVTFIFTSQGPGGNSDVEELYGIGTIYGEKVDKDEFKSEVDKQQDLAQTRLDQQNQQAQQQGRPIEKRKADAVDQAGIWKAFTEELVLKKEYEALGIQVSEAEFDAYLFGESGFTVLPDIASAFSDSAQVFNPKLLESRIDEMENSPDADVQAQWVESKEYYTEQRQKQKYLDLIGQGIYVTTLEAKEEYLAQQEKKSISFVVKKYSEVADKDIKVTYKALRGYYNKHKKEKKYENQISSREVRFADLTIEPSSQDTMDLTKGLEILKKEFAKSTQDSLFVMINSAIIDPQIPRYIPQIGYKAEGDPKAKQNFTYPAHLDTVFKAAQIGDIVGPYIDNGTLKIAKVIGKKDQFLSARHILISAQRADTVAVAKAKLKTDSLMGLITQANFEQYVTDFTEDPGSKETGGKYEDFLDGEMVPEFSKFAIETPIGEIGYVQTDFGFHIMEVLDRRPANIPNLAIVQKVIKPSPNTLQSVEDKAYTLLEKLHNRLNKTKGINQKIAKFDTIVSKAGSVARPIGMADNNPVLSQFSSSFTETEIFRLAFNPEAKEGDVLSSPVKDGNRWIVAMVSSIRVKGPSKFDDVKDLVKREYIKERKFKKIRNEMKGKSLDALSEISRSGLQTAEVIFGSSQIGQFVREEPQIVGAIFGALKDGKLTSPIKGTEGVYVLRIEKTIKAIPAKDYKTERDQLTGLIRGGLSGIVTKALVKQADIVDNRRFSQIGIRR